MTKTEWAFEVTPWKLWWWWWWCWC